MAFDWNQLLRTLNSGLQFGSQLLPRQSGTNTSIGGLNIPNNLLGAGLMTAGVLGDKEPGEVLEARQFLRNQFTSPTATGELMGRNVTGAQTALAPLLGQVGPTGPGQNYLTGLFDDPEGMAKQFSTNVGAVSEQFQPLLTQQRQRGIDDISQRFASAFPTVGAQGSEFGNYARYITDEALPREQAFLGQLGLDLQNRQQSAAGSVFQDEANRRNAVQDMANRGLNIPLDAAGKILDTNFEQQKLGLLSPAQLASLIGSNMLMNGGQGGAGQLSGVSGGGGTSGSGTGQGMGQLGGDIIGQIGQALQSGNLEQLGQLLASGALAGQPFPFGIQASTQAGQLIQQAINAGLVESPAAQVVGQGAAGAGFDAGVA